MFLHYAINMDNDVVREDSTCKSTDNENFFDVRSQYTGTVH
jgi:hypothetical protein